MESLIESKDTNVNNNLDNISAQQKARILSGDDQESNYDPKAPYSETSTLGPIKDVLINKFGGSFAGNQSIIYKPFDPVTLSQNTTTPTNKIDHSQPDESKVSSLGYLFKTVG